MKHQSCAQFKAIVEYAPSQRVPKPCSRKDSCEGTILKDLDYLEFLKLIAKPCENLPNAEIQLERKEAELSKIERFQQANMVTGQELNAIHALASPNFFGPAIIEGALLTLTRTRRYSIRVINSTITFHFYELVLRLDQCFLPFAGKLDAGDQACGISV
ncbi:hypothetical protein WN943_015594 [Citrus x changshan-huyou]